MSTRSKVDMLLASLFIGLLYACYFGSKYAIYRCRLKITNLECYMALAFARLHNKDAVKRRREFVKIGVGSHQDNIKEWVDFMWSYFRMRDKEHFYVYNFEEFVYYILKAAGIHLEFNRPAVVYMWKNISVTKKGWMTKQDMCRYLPLLSNCITPSEYKSEINNGHVYNALRSTDTQDSFPQTLDTSVNNTMNTDQSLISQRLNDDTDYEEQLAMSNHEMAEFEIEDSQYSITSNIELQNQSTSKLMDSIQSVIEQYPEYEDCEIVVQEEDEELSPAPLLKKEKKQKRKKSKDKKKEQTKKSNKIDDVMYANYN